MNSAIVHDDLAAAQKHFSRYALRNDYFAASGRFAVKADFRQCEIRGRKFYCLGRFMKLRRTASGRAKLSPETLSRRGSAKLPHRDTAMPDCPRLNKLSFPADSAGHCGRKPPNAFCFIMKLLPVCLRVGFQFGGRINDRNGKNSLFQNGTKLFESQLKSVLCLVP
jgi:hypothetical protein